jgi:hypothetical protein
LSGIDSTNDGDAAVFIQALQQLQCGLRQGDGHSPPRRLKFCGSADPGLIGHGLRGSEIMITCEEQSEAIFHLQTIAIENENKFGFLIVIR